MLCEAISTHCAQQNSERPLEHTPGTPKYKDERIAIYQLMMASQPPLPQHTPQPQPPPQMRPYIRVCLINH